MCTTFQIQIALPFEHRFQGPVQT